MKSKVLFFAAVMLLVFMLAGCTILTSEEAALVGTGEPETEKVVLYLNTPEPEQTAGQSDVNQESKLPDGSDDTSEQSVDVNAAENDVQGEADEIQEEQAETPVDSVSEERDLTPLPASFFDDAVFFGDSVSATLEYMDDHYGVLGNAITLVKDTYTLKDAANPNEKNAGTIGYGNARGGPAAILASLPNVHKAFIMLGANDIDSGSEQDYTALWTKLVEDIRKARPDMKIYIQSLTPVTAANDGGNLNNTAIDKYNEQLREFAAGNDCNYITVGEHFKNEKGALNADYARTGGKLLDLGCGQMWVDILKNPANYDIDPRTGE